MPNMKKVFHNVVLVMCLLISGALYAQQGLKIGAFVLPQNSMLLNADDAGLSDDAFQYELLGGMSGGLVAGYNPVEYFGIRLNVMYSQQGGKYSVRSGVETRDAYVTRLEYLKIPLMIGFNSGFTNNKLIFSLYGGVQAGFLSRAYTYNNSVAYEAPLPENYTNFPTVSNRYERFDLSAVGDIGVDVALTYNMVLNLHLRGDYSLQDAEDKTQEFRITEGGATRNQKYWEWARGLTKNAETRNLTTGLLIGVTYTFGQDQ
jgi:hypothetical protein